MNLVPAALLTLLLAAPLSADLVEKSVTYEHEGTTLEGFHVYDDAQAGPRPGVLVIHQWTGLSEYEKSRSRQLAELGYNVFAADIYGRGIRPQPPAAGQEAGKYKADRSLYRGRLQAALAQLQQEEHTDPAKIAAIGYCFGGMGALELARSGTPLAGVASFHGSLDAQREFRAEAGNIPAKVLILHGSADPFAPPSHVEALGKELSDAKADWQLILYGGAVHSFTQKEAGDDPSQGSAYNASADRRSWEALKQFLAELFS